MSPIYNYNTSTYKTPLTGSVEEPHYPDKTTVELFYTILVHLRLDYPVVMKQKLLLFQPQKAIFL